jgi:hypothetical protein
MKKYVLILLAMTTVLLVGTGFKFNEAVAADHDPAGPQCQSNCFWGYVYVQDWFNRPFHPGQGITVYLYYCLSIYPPSDTLIGTRQTDNQGKYCFCKGEGQWDSGTYRIKVGRHEKEVYREGNGDIQVDFYLPFVECEPVQPVHGDPQP